MAESEASDDVFAARNYQQELFKHSRSRNSILVLATGSGKTFISIMLIKELGAAIRGTHQEAKRTVFIVNTVPLVYQQADAICRHTPYTVGRYEGSMGIDYWTQEQWKEEIDQHEILVMVAEVCHSLILHNRLPLEKINLIIIDECHHATGNHPMSKIMREYWRMKTNSNIALPKILGLTACIINGKCKSSKVYSVVKDLERTMDSTIVTSRYQEIVRDHSTKAQETVIGYNDSVNSNTGQLVKHELEMLEDEISDMLEDIYDSCETRKKKKKFVKRTITEMISSIDEMGDYTLRETISLEAEYLYKAEAESLEEQEIYRTFSDRLRQILENIPPMENRNIMKHISEKVKTLIFVLQKYAIPDDSLRIIVFVEKRNTAKILHSLLLKIKDSERLSFLAPSSIVGGTTNMRDDLKVQQKIENQKKILSDFRKGVTNIIFSTSVLEEGIDVQKCNLVIRFDKPKSFSSYFQSLGRARAASSKYILLSNDSTALKRELREFKELSEVFIGICHNRSLKVGDDEEDYANIDIREGQVYEPYGPNGPKITYHSAIQLINKFCGSLPHDKFTQSNATYKIFELAGEFQASITLPRNAPLLDDVFGEVARNKMTAKKSAALKLCIDLHNIGELTNENLLPRKLENDFQFINLPIEYEQVDDDEPQPGSKKRRQVYSRQLCKQFRNSENVKYLYLHRVEFGECSVVTTNKQKLGFLCAEPLSCCKFHLDSFKTGKIETEVTCIQRVSVDEDIIQKIKYFHMTAYKLLFNLGDDMTFCMDGTQHAVLLVPLNSEGKIDSDLLNRVLTSFSSFKDGRLCKNTVSDIVSPDMYKDSVVVPMYRDSEPLMVEKILLNMNPLSPFPDSTQHVRNFRDYYKIKYGIDIKNNEQFLLKCLKFPKELNYIKNKNKLPKKRDHAHHLEIYIPELCLVLPFTASFWWQIKLVPSVLHRINGLMLEKQLFENINYKCLPEEKINFNSELDYCWSRQEVQKLTSNGSNLVELLHSKSKMSVYPGMILQALTSCSADDNFNFERLEVLGDSFLKFAVGVFLFCKERIHHEGKLTMERSQIVSNKTLYTLASRKKIPELYQGFIFNRTTITCYGFQNAGIDDNELLTEGFDLREKQAIRDKSIADCVESLTGVYLLTGGEAAARHFLIWLGFKFLNENPLPPNTALVRNKKVTPAEVNNIYQKLCLDELEKSIQYEFHDKTFLIQAVTHSSDYQNVITDCYQRLEYLGDAVLDYLITGYIFSEFYSFDPGQLTDLRSHLVNNETLGRSSLKLGLHKYLQHCSLKLSTCIDIFIDQLQEGEAYLITEDDAECIEDVEVPKALGDMAEAIIGAVYIDSGRSLLTCWKFVKSLLAEEFTGVQEKIPINIVREFYEIAAVNGIDFEMQEISPVEDKPAECIINFQNDDYPPITGYGKNKRVAKQSAARKALKFLRTILNSLFVSI